jgi:alkylation response protein AidB-like acyl-CoA dehydrogenase
MTERTGGSDVGRTETIAKLQPDGSYKLYGYKFFTSSITSEMSLLLARIESPSGETTLGSKGLSTFLLQTRKPDGSLNELIVHKLKDKMGTKVRIFS